MPPDLLPSSGNEELHERRAVFIGMLDEFRKIHDWHGMRDACVEIEKVEAQLRILA